MSDRNIFKKSYTKLKSAFYTVNESIQNFLDVFAPFECPFCKGDIPHTICMCSECRKRVQFINGTMCHRCGRPLSPDVFQTDEKLLCFDCMLQRPIYDQARSAYVYDSFSRFPILRFKHYAPLKLIPFFLHIMTFAGQELFDKVDIVVPVPMHWVDRLFIRKRNATDILAHALAHKIKKPCYSRLLYKTKFRNIKQEGKSREERIKNVVGLYKARKSKKLEGKSVLLIDDVLTTGSTANACAKELRKAGARAVYVLTIASTQNKNSPTYFNYED